jgi:ADP-heptose:LPS heptosyltransferase
LIEDYLPSSILNRVRIISSKKLGFTIFQELLLIHCADYAVGSNTGPMTLRKLTDKPYLMLDYRTAEVLAVSHDYYGNSLRHPLDIPSQVVLHEADRLSIEDKRKAIEDYLGTSPAQPSATPQRETPVPI